MQDMLLDLNFPVEKDEHGKNMPNSGWKSAYDEALKDVFVMDDAGKVLAIKNQATLTFWQSQAFPKLAAIQHGMAKIAPKKIKEGRDKAVKKSLEQLGVKPKGPTAPAVSGTPGVDGVDIGWDVEPGSTEAEAYLDKKKLI